MHASTLNHKPDIRMQKCSRLLCTTAGREKRARTHTNTHTNRCGDDWFEGFIGDSQSHQAGREEGAMHFQERRHLLQLNLGCFPRTLEDTDYVVLSCSCFTSTKVQILAPAECRAPLHLLYEYNITDTDTWRTLIPFFNILMDEQAYSQSYQWELSTKSYGCTSFRPAQSAMIEDYIRRY